MYRTGQASCVASFDTEDWDSEIDTQSAGSNPTSTTKYNGVQSNYVAEPSCFNQSDQFSRSSHGSLMNPQEQDRKRVHANYNSESRSVIIEVQSRSIGKIIGKNS